MLPDKGSKIIQLNIAVLGLLEKNLGNLVDDALIVNLYLDMPRGVPIRLKQSV